MSQSNPITLYNTLKRRKEPLVPMDPDNVRMYVCGPTVYDFAHIGNARPAIVFDLLFRLLRHVYGAGHVTYVRNITDVDDKINARAARDYPGLPLNAAIRKVTETTAGQYLEDVKSLGCLDPTAQPRATEHVDGMIAMIQTLIDKGHAYVARGGEGAEVLFDTTSMADYGALSRRNLDEQMAGARVAVEAHKRNPADFVLWKESAADEPGWDGDFTEDGRTVTVHGRPGWHIECSVMAETHLGPVFDIHGGGLDLIFPHHENEIAQSRCAHGSDVMANIWMHNGFLQVEGQKMSKSLGNFFTIHELMHTEKFGGRKWPGEVLRLAMLMTHYREPIDFSVRKLEEAENMLAKWPDERGGEAVPGDVLAALSDDLNTVEAVKVVHGLAGNPAARDAFAAAADLLGIAPLPKPEASVGEAAIEAAIARRLALIRDKNWPEADRIRDELLVEGIQLKDGKDPETGERITTWEVRR